MTILLLGHQGVFYPLDSSSSRTVQGKHLGNVQTGFLWQPRLKVWTAADGNLHLSSSPTRWTAVRGSKHIKFCLVPSPVSPPTGLTKNRTDYAERRTRYASASGQAALHQHSPNVQTGLYIHFSPRRKTATEDDSLQGPSHIFSTDLTLSHSWCRHNRPCVVTWAAWQSGNLEWTQAFNYHTVSTPSLVEVAQQICLRTQQQPQPDPRDFASLLHPQEAAMQVADSCVHPNATVHRHEHPPAATLLFTITSK